MVHFLKTEPKYFQEVKSKKKTFEIRENDRRFNIEDTLMLLEYDTNNGFTGHVVAAKVTYMLTDERFLPSNYICMAIDDVHTPVYWYRNEKKSCFNCIHSLKSKGYRYASVELGEPPIAECYNKSVNDDMFNDIEWVEDDVPEKCEHYSPVTIDNCVHCGKEINKPVFDWPYWFTWYSESPCCSKECIEAAEKRAYEVENYDASLARYETL